MYLCIIRSSQCRKQKARYNGKISPHSITAFPAAIVQSCRRTSFCRSSLIFSSISFPFILIVMLKKIHFCYIIVIHKEGLVDTEEIFPTICEFLLYVIQFSIKICSASILQENMHYSVAAFKVHNIFLKVLSEFSY